MQTEPDNTELLKVWSFGWEVYVWNENPLLNKFEYVEQSFLEKNLFPEIHAVVNPNFQSIARCALSDMNELVTVYTLNDDCGYDPWLVSFSHVRLRVWAVICHSNNVMKSFLAIATPSHHAHYPVLLFVLFPSRGFSYDRLIINLWRRLQIIDFQRGQPSAGYARGLTWTSQPSPRVSANWAMERRDPVTVFTNQC